MSRIRSRDTKPEIEVRKALSSLGLRYRLYKKDLPGKPDIVVPKKKVAVFVNGCFWHQHEGCKRKSLPKSNKEYWEGKLKENVARQKRDIRLLEESGWKVCLIWECETKDVDLIEKKLREVLYDGEKCI